MPEFNENDHLLVRHWIEKVEHETGFSSNPGTRIVHPLFRKIVEIGMPVLPVILSELRKGRVGFWWFEALHQITGVDPCKTYGKRFRAVENISYIGPGNELKCWHWWAIQRIAKRKMLRAR